MCMVFLPASGQWRQTVQHLVMLYCSEEENKFHLKRRSPVWTIYFSPDLRKDVFPGASVAFGFCSWQIATTILNFIKVDFSEWIICIDIRQMQFSRKYSSSVIKCYRSKKILLNSSISTFINDVSCHGAFSFSIGNVNYVTRHWTQHTG